MKNLKIILNIFYHVNEIQKTFIENNKHLYIPINGGSSLQFTNSWNSKNLFFDNSFDNISHLNSKLNELTSIYWFWKNKFKTSNIDYIGFNHYRRYFNPKDFYHDFEKYDIIVGKKEDFNITVLEQYKKVHDKFDIKILEDLLALEYPRAEVIKFMNQKALYAPCNMYIMKSSLFDLYCKVIFKIILKLEKVVILDKHNPYQYRALAFLSERLTSFWMFQQKKTCEIKEIPIEFFKGW